MTLETFIQAMPKAELHVHLEGAIQPEVLLVLAQRNGVALPADTVEGLRAWYTFTSFAHFVQIYLAISACIQTPEDIEFIAHEFLAGQVAQNIRYCEVTYTPFTHYHFKGLTFREQLAALSRARAWGAAELGVQMNVVLDISRNVSPEDGLTVADWAIEGMNDGVVALGLGGPEVGNPPEKFVAAFERARAAGLSSVPHAGETVGPVSVWGALQALGAVRIGHGVRCVEDPALVAELRARQTPLEVCPTSNVCLGVAPSIAGHQLPRLLDEGLYVTLNSDDPPMFNTSLTGEFLAAAQTYGWDADTLERLTLNAVRATLLPAADRAALETRFVAEFARVRAEHLPPS